MRGAIAIIGLQDYCVARRELEGVGFGEYVERNVGVEARMGDKRIAATTIDRVSRSDT